jgi:hypothetical protein|tara:strand:+ start:1229 stop:1396 length:168 start_codon:yes stop_codon:yes gene_type:complete
MTIEEDYPRSEVKERPRTKNEAKEFKKQFKPPWEDISTKLLLIIIALLLYGVFFK